MIAPRPRLLLWTGLVVVPFSALAGVLPENAGLCAAVLCVVAALVMWDAVQAPGALTGVTAALPDVVRLTRGREGEIVVRLGNEQEVPRAVRVGLPLPRGVASVHGAVSVSLPAHGARSRLSWACLPGKRGCFRLRACYLEGTSPLGFWAARQRVAVETELRVYPSLQAERRLLAGLFLNRGTVGVHLHRQVGQGREFEKLREYLPGDPFADVHWKATAKRGRPVTKQFQVEQTQEVYVVLDASRLSLRPCASGAPAAAVPEGTDVSAEAVLERFIAAALSVGLVAERQGDMFGLLAFSDRIDSFVRAKGGRTHFNACRESLHTLEGRPVSPDFGELCAFIRLRMRRRALLVMLTSLDDPVLAESFVRNVDGLRHHHVVLVNMVRPADVRPLFTDRGVREVGDIYAHLGGHLRWQELQGLRKLLRSHGVAFTLMDSGALCVQLVTQYLNVKQRQLL